MQVGSLVECINGTLDETRIDKNEIFPKESDIYTVRAVFQSKDGTFLHLDEIVNKPQQYKDEYGECRFNVEMFKVIQSPMNLSEIFADQLKINKTESKPIKAPKARKKRTHD